MVKYPYIWQSWAARLHSWGVSEWIAALLDAAGPLTTIGAQVIYISQPILNTLLPNDHLVALANMLEEPQTTKTFTRYLREELNA